MPRGVAIYYVSDRYEENKDATVTTLKALGLPGVDAHVRLLGQRRIGVPFGRAIQEGARHRDAASATAW